MIQLALRKVATFKSDIFCFVSTWVPTHLHRIGICSGRTEEGERREEGLIQSSDKQTN